MGGLHKITITTVALLAAAGGITVQPASATSTDDGKVYFAIYDRHGDWYTYPVDSGTLRFTKIGASSGGTDLYGITSGGQLYRRQNTSTSAQWKQICPARTFSDVSYMILDAISQNEPSGGTPTTGDNPKAIGITSDGKTIALPGCKDITPEGLPKLHDIFGYDSYSSSLSFYRALDAEGNMWAKGGHTDWEKISDGKTYQSISYSHAVMSDGTYYDYRTDKQIDSHIYNNSEFKIPGYKLVDYNVKVHQWGIGPYDYKPTSSDDRYAHPLSFLGDDGHIYFLRQQTYNPHGGGEIVNLYSRQDLATADGLTPFSYSVSQMIDAGLFLEAEQTGSGTDGQQTIVLLTGAPGKTSVTHSLQFDLNGAPGIAPQTQTLDEATVPAKPADPTWDGRTFAGWYTDPVNGSQFDFTQPLTTDMTVYARWKTTGTTIACAPQTGDPAASIWQWSSMIGGLACIGLAGYLMVLRRKARSLVS